MQQLCSFLGVDPKSVVWDAATEALDGDVQSVMGNIMRAKYGEDWGPRAASPASPIEQDGFVEPAGKPSDQLVEQIYRVLRGSHLSNMVFEGTEDPYCLVDAVTAKGQNITDGEEQLGEIAYDIASALAASRPSPPEEDVR
jgi:hypothetical protein